MTEYQLLADTVARAGEIMLKSGAETYRVEETIKYMIEATEEIRGDVVVLATGLVVTIEGKKGEAEKTITIARRVNDRDTNLSNISTVNEMSREYCAGRLTLSEVKGRLEGLENQSMYSPVTDALATLGTCVAFSLLLGASALECLVAAINGVIYTIGLKINKRLKIRRFVVNMCISIVMTVISAIACRLSTSLNQELIIAGSVMPMLPGVAITNAVRDIFQGDYTSGGARTLEAFVVAIFIAVGIGFGMLFVRAVM